MKKIYLIPLIIIATIIVSACSKEPREPYKYDSFAECLTEKGVKMYGTDWCPHCQDQKKAFGPSFDKVDYIDCQIRLSVCREADIAGYPTWIFQGEERLTGAQDLVALAEKSGCELPTD